MGSRRVWLVAGAALIAVTVVTMGRLVAIRSAVFAGHADPSFYFEVGRNLASGRGAVVDYAWHFRPPPSALTHYAFDYWMPLPALSMAAGMAVLGTDLVHALQVVVGASVVLAGLASLVAWALVRDRLVACVVAPLTITVPALGMRLVSAESIVFYVIGLAATFLCALRARRRSGWWLGAGVCAGLTYLCRGDGLLTIVTVVLASLFWPERRLRQAALGRALLGILAIVMPLVVIGLVHLGRPTPTPPGLLTLTRYEDLYALPDDPDVPSALDQGIAWHVRLRLDVLQELARQAWYDNGPFSPWIALGIVLFAWPRGRRRTTLAEAVRSPWAFPVANLLLLATFWLVAVPLLAPPGGWARSLAGYSPFFLTAAVSGWLRPFGRRWRALGGAGLAVLLGLACVDTIAASRGVVQRLNESGERFASLRGRVASFGACTGLAPVVMTRDPWEATEVTRVASVQIPNAAVDRIAEVIHRFGVTHVAVDPKRPQLDAVRLAALGFRAVDAGPLAVFERDVSGAVAPDDPACAAFRDARRPDEPG